MTGSRPPMPACVPQSACLHSLGLVRPNHLEPCTHSRHRSWQLDACANTMFLVLFVTAPCFTWLCTAPTPIIAFATHLGVVAHVESRTQLAAAVASQPLALNAMKMKYNGGWQKGLATEGKEERAKRDQAGAFFSGVRERRGLRSFFLFPLGTEGSKNRKESEEKKRD